MRQGHPHLGVWLCLALVLGPATAWAEEWFDAYERGLQALKQRKPAKAVELLLRAIELRPDPGNNLITYGTNRLTRYHPYLRLAEAHLLSGEPQAASQALKRSEALGKEPAEERGRIAALVEAALERARAAAAPPPPTTLAALVTAPPTVPAATAPPATVAAAPPPAQPAGPLQPPILPPRVGLGPGILVLRSEPAGATVHVNGQERGRTPLMTPLPAGEYLITLRREGFADQTFAVKVEAHRRTVESRALVATGPAPAAAPSAAPPALEPAALILHSQPTGASVYLDEEPLGTTDPISGRLVKTGISPGAHRIRLTLPGHADFSQEVQVGPAGPTTLKATLTVVRRPGVPRAVGVIISVLVLGALGLLAWARRQSAMRRGETVALPAASRPRPATTAPPTPRRTAVSPATLSTHPTLEALETRALRAPSASPTGAPTGTGEWFGEYRLFEQLGKGGMASVYKAERNGQVCALKRPLSAFVEEPEFLERFLREAEIGRTLHHHNIIRIFERGDVGGVPYFTMELVNGETLQAHVRRMGALDPRAATKVIVQVAEALDYAHLKGVIHRDLKPSNIMILEDGTVKVMDYGIARARRFDGLTVTGAFLGTPDYVAPETAEGKGTDARSDLYSLGIVFYEILTGRKPFVGDTPFATLRKHCTEPPTPPSVHIPNLPRELEAVALRLLRKNPDERYPGAEELLIELRDYLNRAA